MPATPTIPVSAAVKKLLSAAREVTTPPTIFVYRISSIPVRLATTTTQLPVDAK
jgi:hypothetical protein